MPDGIGAASLVHDRRPSPIASRWPQTRCARLRPAPPDAPQPCLRPGLRPRRSVARQSLPSGVLASAPAGHAARDRLALNASRPRPCLTASALRHWYAGGLPSRVSARRAQRRGAPLYPARWSAPRPAALALRSRSTTLPRPRAPLPRDALRATRSRSVPHPRPCLTASALANRFASGPSRPPAAPGRAAHERNTARPQSLFNPALQSIQVQIKRFAGVQSARPEGREFVDVSACLRIVLPVVH